MVARALGILLTTLAVGAAALSAAVSASAAGEPTRVRSVDLPGTAEALTAEAGGGTVRLLLSQGSANPRPSALSTRAGRGGLVEPVTPIVSAPDLADIQAVLPLQGDGTMTVYDTRGDGYVGNELLAVVNDGQGRTTEQRLNPPSTQASELFWNSIAVGPTGTLAVPYVETALPYSAAPTNYAIAVRPAGAAAFGPAQSIFPPGAHGPVNPNGFTFLGPDGGGWVFLLPDGEDWRKDHIPVIVARRIEPDGRLGALLELPLPLRRPGNVEITMAARYDGHGRLVAAFSASAYEPPGSRERSVVWTQTFEAATTDVPPRSIAVRRSGGYFEDQDLDLQFDDGGRLILLARTGAGLRLLRRTGERWRAGPTLTTRTTYTPRLVRLGDGRRVAIWLQPYNRQGDRSHLMVATGRLGARRWTPNRVPRLGRPGLIRLDHVAAFGDAGVAAIVYARGERLVVTQIAR